MRKNLSSIALITLLMLPAVLTIISTIEPAAAAGNLTINNFTCNITKGTVPLDTRLRGDVTGEVTRWRWDFYNPQLGHWSYSSNNSSSVTTSHTFGRIAGAIGVFNVTLNVWGPNGAHDSLKKIDFVVGNKNTTGLPNASFVASATSGDAPLNVTFTDTSQDATSSLWYFGEMDSSKDKNPSFTFTSPGTYRVVLEVKNARGWDATAQDIIVGGVPQGAVLPVAAFDAVTSNGLEVQFTDLSTNADVHEWDFGDGATSTEISPSHTYSAAGDYDVQLTVSNGNGKNSISKTVSVQDSSSSDESDSDGGSHHSSGGGGGSVGGSPEPQSNVETKEVAQTFIASGNPVLFNFPQATTPIVNISFVSKKTYGRTTAIAEVLKNQSTLVTGAPADEVYKFINIWVGSSGLSTSDNIENAAVYFKVEKSWIQDKNMDKSSITLNRYSDSNWTALPTNLSAEDDNYLYFTAQTPGFSPFAITARALQAAQPEVPAVTTVEKPENNTGNASTIEKSPAEAQTQATKIPGFEAVIGIGSLLAVFLHKRRK